MVVSLSIIAAGALIALATHIALTGAYKRELQEAKDQIYTKDGTIRSLERQVAVSAQAWSDLKEDYEKRMRLLENNWQKIVAALINQTKCKDLDVRLRYEGRRLLGLGAISDFCSVVSVHLVEDSSTKSSDEQGE